MTAPMIDQEAPCEACSDNRHADCQFRRHVNRASETVDLEFAVFATDAVTVCCCG